MVNDVKPGGVFLINCQWNAEELNRHMPAEAKRYIAKNNIQLYTVNAIDIAAEIGLGKRTNTVLQSAFFSLSKVLPEAEAIGYMKEKAQKFMKKGKEIVEMNEKAIDAGIPVVVCSQCLYERSDFSVYQVGQKALAKGAIQGFDMTREAAVTKLMWALGHTRNLDEVRAIFHTNMAGEITL